MTRLAAIFLCIGLSFGGTARAEKIVINQAGPSLTASSIYLADILGYFREQGLDVAFISTGSGMKSIVPLVSGSAQFCACIVFHPFQANFSGAGETRLIAGITVGYGTKIVLRTEVATQLHLLPATPLRERVMMLRGLKIGVTELNASTDQALRVVMKTFDLKPETDATILAMGGLTGLVPAIEHGQIDAVSGSPPVPEQMIRDGTAVLLVDPIREHVGLLDKAMFMGLAADTAYLAEHRDIAERVVRAIAKGQAFLHQDKEKARQVLKAGQFPTMPQDAFDAAFDAQYPSYLATPALPRASIDAAVTIATRFLPGFADTYDTLVDLSFMPADDRRE